MWRIFGILCLLCGLAVPHLSRAAAADIGMPTDADVTAAVGEEIASWNVCSGLTTLNFNMEGGVASLGDKAWRESDRVKKAIDALVHEKLATRGMQPDQSGNSAPILQLTATGKKALAGIVNMASNQTSLCFAKRKLADVVMYTPPAVHDTYVVVHVVYHWKMVDVAPWAAPLARAQALGNVSEADLTAAKSDTTVLIFTNHGWKAQGWFGNPIGK